MSGILTVTGFGSNYSHEDNQKKENRLLSENEELMDLWLIYQDKRDEFYEARKKFSTNCNRSYRNLIDCWRALKLARKNYELLRKLLW